MPYFGKKEYVTVDIYISRYLIKIQLLFNMQKLLCACNAHIYVSIN